MRHPVVVWQHVSHDNDTIELVDACSNNVHIQAIACRFADLTNSIIGWLVTLLLLSVSIQHRPIVFH